MVNVPAIPDYSNQAAVELKVEASRWSACAQRVVDDMDSKALAEALLLLSLQLKNAANLLGYSSMRFGMAEVAELLHYRLKNKLSDKDTANFALILLQVGDELQALTSLPASQARRVSALNWLPVIDNCRACRQVAALSKDVVAAAGIALPSMSKLPVPAKQDCEEFLMAIKAVHRTFAQQLMASLRDKHSVEQLVESSKNFVRLAQACRSENRLSALEPLFRSAGVVLESIVKEPERYSVAVQRLYAKLERYLAELSRMDADLLARTGNLVPDDILRQLLFYVAGFAHPSSDAKKLRSEFGLQVLNTEATGGDFKDATYEKLRVQISQQMDVELIELQSWMNQAAADPKHKRAKRLFKRLGEQHLAAGILGLSDLEEALAHLRQNVRELKQTGGSADVRLQMAAQILRVRDLLLSPAHKSNHNAHIGGLRKHSVDGVAAKLKQLSRRKDKSQFHTESVKACLKSVQSELRQAEPELLELFNGRPSINGSAHDIANRFDQSARALKLLPLPEVAPLIEGLASAIRTSVSAHSSHTFQNNIAELLVAMDLYIDSLVLESKSLTPLLQHAVSALQSLSPTDSTGTLAVNSLTQAIAEDSTVVLEESNESLLDTFLLVNQRVNPWLNNRVDDHSEVVAGLHQLSGAAQNAKLTELHGLVSNCESYVQQSPLPSDAKELVAETLLVVPQMLHAEPGVAESVRGLDALKARLTPGVVSDDVSGDVSGAVAGALLGSASLGVSSLAGTSGDMSGGMSNDGGLESQDSMDNTLHDVFARECTSHIETLRKAIRVARADLPLAKLPSDDMLRALHTLSGCTQTVDAVAIVAVVQPLQKAALGLQRCGLNFSNEETDYIEKLAGVMEARLQHFQHQREVNPDVLEIEGQLPGFVSSVLARTQSVPGTSTSNLQATAERSIAPGLLAKSNRVAPTEAGLSSIFRAEADDLILRLRAHTASLLSDGDAPSKEGALRVLHTIKGSARMSGSHAMADAAHELENEVAGVVDGKAFGEILRQRLPELQACLGAGEQSAEDSVFTDETLTLSSGLQATKIDLSASAPIDSEDFSEKVSQQSVPTLAPVHEESLEQLLHTGSTLVSRQAEVDGRIGYLSEHIRDIQASALRLQQLATDNPAFDSVASRELVADIQVAQRQLDHSLQALQHTHGLAAHTGTALHRALMQARLKNVDSLLPRLTGALSDAKTVCQREASLLLTGGDLPVSATLLNALAPLLEQLIRNAIAHGLDSAAVREAAQKPADGEIAIAVRVDGTDLLIDVSDDGEGVDEDALNQQRAEEGLKPIRGAKHLREVLCSPGYSTLENATPVAGRGQGLSMVLDGVEALSGDLEFINDPGEGLTARMRIPQPMVVAKSLVFGDGSILHAIPVGYIAHVVPFDENISAIEHNDQTWPVCTIEQLIGVPLAQSTAQTATRCVLIKIRGENLAIPVPSLDGYKELIVQPLGGQLQSLERYVGGAVLSDGRSALILNLHRLYQNRLMNQQSSISASDRPEPAKRRTALIADDSVTMRVAGERLLQRLGFQVHTARDGLEALDFLKRGLPSVLLLDIEMPGADGFDVVRRTHAKLVAAEVPVIMISTRRGPVERERARSLGIQHLIHKPYTETRLREALEEVGVLESTDEVN